MIKLQFHITREAAKISAFSSGKIDKYEYLTGEEILPSNQREIIKEVKFAYSILGKTFEKQTTNKRNWRAMEKNKQMLLGTKRKNWQL